MLYLYPHSGCCLALDDGDLVLGGDEASPLERVVHPRLLSRLGSELRRRRPDVVQVNGARAVKYGAALRALRPSWRLVYRNIDSPHFWVRGRVKRALFRNLMQQVDGVVGVSRRTLDQVESFYGLAVPHVLIENGVDLGPLRQHLDRVGVRVRFDVPDGAVVLLFLGALAPQKRADRFVRLVHAAHASGRTVRAWLVGEGPLRRQLQEQVEALGLTEVVRLIGAVDRVGPIIDAADVVVSTSDTEGIPASLIEASHLERPIVAMGVGGVAEVIRDGETGLLVPAGDEAELARAVFALVDDPQLRRALGQTGRRFVDGTFSILQVGPAYERFYEHVLRSAR